MNGLTNEQEKLLKQEYERIKKSGVDRPHIDYIPEDTWNTIEEINPDKFYASVQILFCDLNDDGYTHNPYRAWLVKMKDLS